MLACKDPTLYLDEYVDWLALTHGVLVSKQTISRTIRHMGLTKKKLRKTATQHDEAVHAQWSADNKTMYSADQFVFVDEAGVNNGNLEQTHGRAQRGERAVISTPFASLGSCYTIIPALTLADGYITVRLVQGLNDGDGFLDFLVKEVVHMFAFASVSSC